MMDDDFTYQTWIWADMHEKQNNFGAKYLEDYTSFRFDIKMSKDEIKQFVAEHGLFRPRAYYIAHNKGEGPTGFKIELNLDGENPPLYL